MRNFSHPGRSPVYGSRMMCATSHPLATLSALDVLRDEGSAMDAAISAAAVQAVVEPHMTGIGGDCFALIWTPEGGIEGYNGSGAAPERIDPESVAALYPGALRLPETSPHSVTIPGAIEAWERMHQRYGRVPWDRLFKDAIRYAEDGYVVAPRVASDWADLTDKLAENKAAAEQYLVNGLAPRSGDRADQPRLATSLRAIAGGGADAFYRGVITEQLVESLRSLGGSHTVLDFGGHRGAWVTPVSSSYDGLDVMEIPPNGQGITTLVLLNILRHFEMRLLDPLGPERFHLEMEASRLAYAVRNSYVADPKFVDVPVAHMLGDTLAADLAARIDPKRRRNDLAPVPPPPDSDTVYLCVVDENGMAVSFINSLFSGFGSGICAGETGILLQNRGSGFLLEAGHRNSLAASKRPLHTIIPAMALAHGAPELVFGVMGGQYQPTGQAHVLTSLRDFDMDPQEAIDCPRMFFNEQGLIAESSVPNSTVRTLGAMGHHVAISDEPMGGGQMIAIDHRRGVLVGASDPRKDGMAAGM